MLEFTREWQVNGFRTDSTDRNFHCVGSVRIRRFSGPCFPAFGLNTESRPDVGLLEIVEIDLLLPTIPIKPERITHGSQTHCKGGTKNTAAKVKPKVLLCISSNCTNPPNHQESRGRETRVYDIDNSCLAKAEVVARPFAFMNEKTHFSSQ